MKKYANFSKKDKENYYSKVALDASKPPRQRAFARKRLQEIRSERPNSKEFARLAKIASFDWVHEKE